LKKKGEKMEVRKTPKPVWSEPPAKASRRDSFVRINRSDPEKVPQHSRLQATVAAEYGINDVTLKRLSTVNAFQLFYGRSLVDAAFPGSKLFIFGAGVSDQTASGPSQYMTQIMKFCGDSGRLLYYHSGEPDQIVVTGATKVDMNAFFVGNREDSLGISHRNMPVYFKNSVCNSLVVAPLISSTPDVLSLSGWIKRGFFILTNERADAYDPEIGLKVFNEIRQKAAQVMSANGLGL
jgi:hypothetical protein